VAIVARARTAGASSSEGAGADDRPLLWAAALFTFAVLVHGADHVRRGADSVGRDVFWVGTAALVLEVGVVVLVTQRHRLAPLAAVAAGFALAAGYLLVHFLPARAWLSDSFPSAVDVSPLSWGAASLEVVAALALGVAGLLVLHRRGGLASAARPNPGQLDLRAALVHPVALAMLLGNAAVLALSLVDLLGS
jgi:hypothetical protein